MPDTDDFSIDISQSNFVDNTDADAGSIVNLANDGVATDYTKTITITIELSNYVLFYIFDGYSLIL